MYSKILVAVDESETSLHALKHAIEMARKLAATVRMIHVLDMGWLPIGPEVAIDTGTLSSARRRMGEKIIAAARDTAQQAGLEAEAGLIETETPIQQVAEVIAREASRWGADLVVIGTHGRRGFQHLMLGRVAERMARLSSVPVLLIPLPKEASSA